MFQMFGHMLQTFKNIRALIKTFGRTFYDKYLAEWLVLKIFELCNDIT